MLSFARNERGIRLASAAILFLPVAALVWCTSRSPFMEFVTLAGYGIFAAIALFAFLRERAEEDRNDER